MKLLPAVPAAAAEESWVVATDLAEALARAGTPFHQAHQIVGRFVLESVRSGRKPADWTPAEMRRFAPEFTEDMAGLLDPAKRHGIPRGPRRNRTRNRSRGARSKRAAGWLR